MTLWNINTANIEATEARIVEIRQELCAWFRERGLHPNVVTLREDYFRHVMTPLPRFTTRRPSTQDRGTDR